MVGVQGFLFTRAAAAHRSCFGKMLLLCSVGIVVGIEIADQSSDDWNFVCRQIDLPQSCFLGGISSCIVVIRLRSYLELPVDGLHDKPRSGTDNSTVDSKDLFLTL